MNPIYIFVLTHATSYFIRVFIRYTHVKPEKATCCYLLYIHIGKSNKHHKR